MLLGVVGAVVVVCVMLWRNTPQRKAVRFLNNAAETASVDVEDSELVRRMKAAKLRRFIGYECHLDVKGVVRACDLMQDEALAAWAYVVGRERYLDIQIMDLEFVAAEDDKISVNAEVSVDSNYQKGRYSRRYPVLVELAYIERKLRVVSLKSR